MSKIFSIFSHLCYFPPASFLVPGSPAAERAELGPSSGRSSARCCCLSPRLLLTCLMMSARGKNQPRSSRVIANPAQKDLAMRMKIERRRHRHEGGTFLTGSMKGLQSAQRVVGEVWIGSFIYISALVKKNKREKCVCKPWNKKGHHN